MEDNEKKNDISGQEEKSSTEESTDTGYEESASGDKDAGKPSFPTEGDEFGPEDFEDDTNGEPPAAPSEAAAVQSGGNRLPWFLFAASLVAIGIMLYLGRGSDGGSLEGVAAKVNGEEVTKQEVYDIMFEQGGDSLLDNLITEKLIAQEVKKNDIQVDEASVDEELTQFKADFGGEEAFNSALAQYGYTEETIKSQIRTQLEVSKLFESRMDLSEAKQKEYFEQNQARYDTAEQLEISHILLDSQEEADKLLVELKAGADFAAVAQENSGDTGSKDNGGSIGFVSRGQGLDQAFEEAAFQLDKGEMSGVVQSSFGYHIIKVTDKKEAVKATYEDNKEEVKKSMVEEEVNTKAQEWLEGLKESATIEKL